MNDLLEKFKATKHEMAAHHGQFGLFALIEREDLPDRWDVVVAVSWIRRDDYDLLSVIINAIQSRLTIEESTLLSGVVLMNAADELVKQITGAANLKDGVNEFVDCDFNGLAISHMYILASDVAALGNLKQKIRKKSERRRAGRSQSPLRTAHL